MSVDPTKPMVHMDPLVQGNEKDQMIQSMRVWSPEALPAQGVAAYVNHLQTAFIRNLLDAGYNEIDIERIDVRLIPKMDDAGEPDPHGFNVTFVVLASKAIAVVVSTAPRTLQ